MGITILVVSDTHGEMNSLSRLIKAAPCFDMIIHCGDGVRDICSIDIPDNAVVLKVKGNTDMYNVFDIDDIIVDQVLTRTIMVVHGHQFNVRNGFKELVNAAADFNAGVVLFGHTHEQFIRYENPVLFNPGSLSDGYYGIIQAAQDEWIFEHKKIKEG